MNINPETDLDLEKLFLPAWAQESPDTNRFEKYTGTEGAQRGERRRDDRGPRRDGPRPLRREGDRREGGGRPHGEGGPRPQRRDDRGPRGKRDERFGGRPPRERTEPPQPLPEIAASILPDENGVESIARQIKTVGRAFPLFDIAYLILQKPERYSIRFAVKKNPQGQVIQPLFLCALDDTLWLSEDEAVAHVLQKHFATFYQTERTAAEPPKGVYTFVAQCGMSGVILGPPNYHDYQNQLRKLHAERFSRMPFEVYKSRVKIVRDEAVVKQWVEEQSWKTEYVCLNVPEPLKLPNREEVEKHFRATHKDTIIKPMEQHTLTGVTARGIRGGLGRVVMDLLAGQRRFPMQIATSLSQQFAKRGLQFFKVNKTVTHVAVARPHFLDIEVTPVSDGVKRIVEFINANPRCTRRKLMDALAPAPAPAPAPIPVNPPEGEAPAATTPAQPAEPTPERTAVSADLHWLIHQGHVIEFAKGILETAKKPLPKPPKPETKPAEQSLSAVESTNEAIAAVPTEVQITEPVTSTETVVESVIQPAEIAAATTDTPATPQPPA